MVTITWTGLGVIYSAIALLITLVSLNAYRAGRRHTDQNIKLPIFNSKEGASQARGGLYLEDYGAGDFSLRHVCPAKEGETVAWMMRQKIFNLLSRATKGKITTRRLAANPTHIVYDITMQERGDESNGMVMDDE